MDLWDSRAMDAVPRRCLDCLVRDKALCSSMDDGELARLSEIGRRRTVPAGTVISWAGDASTTCANVVSGALKLTASTADGREQIVGLLHPGDFAGQLFAGESSLRVTTLVDTDLCVFPRAGFERVLDDHPRMERLLLERTMASLQDAQGRMLALGRRSTRERVAKFLLDLANRTGTHGADGSTRVEVPISRGDMADYLGMTIETVSRQLGRLKDTGAIALGRGDRDCVILDRRQLEEAACPG